MRIENTIMNEENHLLDESSFIAIVRRHIYRTCKTKKKKKQKKNDCPNVNEIH